MSFRQSRGLPVPSLYIMVHQYLKTENTMTIEHSGSNWNCSSKSMAKMLFRRYSSKGSLPKRRQAVQQPAVNVPSGEPVEVKPPEQTSAD